MKLNRTLFWKLYHKSFDAHGPTTQKTVDALNAILDKFETEKRLKYISWFAYCLATAYHETGIGGNHFVPVKEGKARPGTKAWDQYQSKYWGTGFYGRGLVQLTHKTNYLKVGELLGLGDLFVDNPDLVLKIEYAYEAMIIGMVNGIYRSDSKGKHTLARHLKTDDASVQDYVEAREIINGDKKKNGLMIANYAEKFEHILKDSKISASVISPAVQDLPTPTDDPTPEPQNTGADQTINMENVENAAVAPPAPPPSDTPVEVPAVKTKEGIVSKVKAWHGAVSGAFGTALTGFLAWLQGASTVIIISAASSVTVITIVWMIQKYLKEERQKERDEKERERAYELTKLQMQSAMDTTKQTVVVTK